ncbi:MAG: hypothetical protein JPMHGGIA_02536 [Saprospiraceae bacterium]|nr:hypothetical protein [Saprospiraceae bacterium]
MMQMQSWSILSRIFQKIVLDNKMALSPMPNTGWRYILLKILNQEYILFLTKLYMIKIENQTLQMPHT